MMRFTVTLGPASADELMIRDFLDVAARFRLNASHLTPEKITAWLNRLDAIFRKSRKTIPVVIDLQGAKMRIGSVPPVASLPRKLTFRFQRSSKDKSVIPVPHKLFFDNLREGDLIGINDGRVLVKITSGGKPGATEASGEIVQNGQISSFKGINRATSPIPYLVASDVDRAAIAAAIDFSFVEFAFSFVHDGSEASVIKPLTRKKRLCGKIERPEAMNQLKAIDRAFDETWLCRGDLGAQAGLASLGALQETYVSHFPRLKGAKILAGQVLEYMTHFPQPTRSEVVHLHQCEKQGFDGIVLSDETAVGRNPAAVARFLRLIRGET